MLDHLAQLSPYCACVLRPRVLSRTRARRRGRRWCRRRCHALDARRVLRAREWHNCECVRAHINAHARVLRRTYPTRFASTIRLPWPLACRVAASNVHDADDVGYFGRNNARRVTSHYSIRAASKCIIVVQLTCDGARTAAIDLIPRTSHARR